MSTDTLAAELAAIRRRAEQITGEHGPGECDLNGETCTGHDAERMLGALEAVLELAATWREEPVPTASHAGSVRAANVLRACGNSLDRAISGALLGSKEGSDSGS